MAQCPISPQLTSNCSPLHATMRHAISLPHTGSSELLIVFLFIFSIPPSPREWVWRYAMFRKIGIYRRSGEREKSMKRLSGVLAFYWFSGEQTQGFSPYNLQRPGTWNTQILNSWSAKGQHRQTRTDRSRMHLWANLPMSVRLSML